MTGAGNSYCERQRVWVQCMECGEDMAIGLLETQMKTHICLSVYSRYSRTGMMVFADWVQCMECGEEMAIGLLETQMKTHHRNEADGRRHWEAMSPGREPCTYRMAFLTAGVLRNCPIEGCLGQAATRTAIRVHFFHPHVRYTVIILDERNLPHPWCP